MERCAYFILLFCIHVTFTQEIDIVEKLHTKPVVFDKYSTLGNIFNPYESHQVSNTSEQCTTCPNTSIQEYLIKTKCKGCEFHEKCLTKVEYLGMAAAAFTSCAVSNARPITMCRNCVERFLKFQYIYDDILRIDDDGKRCSDLYVDLDRANIIRTIHCEVSQLWNDAACFNCFGQHEIKGNKTYVVFSEEYKKFFRYYNETVACIAKNTNHTVDLEGSPANLTNATSPCKPCLKNYTSMNEYFAKLENKYNWKICMDIIDTMNTTRHIWTDHYKCHLKHTKNIVVILTATAVLLTPAVFYLAIYCTAKAKEQKIIAQKRLTLTQSASGRY